MTTNSNIRIGTLIHGTLRDEDLLAAFADELDRLTAGDDSPLRRPESVEARELLAIDADEWTEEQQESAAYLINETLFYALNEYAPPHVYFGAHEGDGSDFGFWPIGEPFSDTCETVRISDEDFIDVDCRVHVNINDHGNITVSQLRGEELWSAV
jgi:hypothetical protein